MGTSNINMSRNVRCFYCREDFTLGWTRIELLRFLESYKGESVKCCKCNGLTHKITLIKELESRS